MLFLLRKVSLILFNLGEFYVSYNNKLIFLIDLLYFYVSILGEGYKIGIHHHMDQPIMALSDIDLSPGFVTQLSVTPTLHETTDQGIRIHLDRSTSFIFI